MNPEYIFFHLEVALRKKSDLRIYAFKNVSHIPTEKLIEIFKIDLSKDPQIIEGYFLKRKRYRKFKKYIKQNIGQINLDVFEYCLRRYSGKDFSSVRKLYKESLME